MKYSVQTAIAPSNTDETTNRGYRNELSTRLISTVADFGRILGATAIFYYHVGLRTGFPWSRWGEYAVALFIVLSGVAYAGFSSIKPVDMGSYRRYIKSRLRAVFPTFLVVNCGIFASGFFFPSALGRPFTLTEFLLSSAGVSQYFDHRYLSTVMWFVPFILQAYLIFPFINYVLDRTSAVFVIVAVFLISLAFIALVFFFCPIRGVEICRNWSVVFRLPEVCTGIILGRCIFRTSGRFDGFAALAVFTVFSLALAMVASHFPSQSRILSLPWKGLILTAIISAVAIVAVTISRNSMNERQLRFLGAASFPFYLVHGIAVKFIYSHFGSSVLVWLLYFLMCWGSAIILSVLLRHLLKRIS